MVRLTFELDRDTPRGGRGKLLDTTTKPAPMRSGQTIIIILDILELLKIFRCPDGC